MSQKPRYRTPALGEDLIKLVHENATDAWQYLELLALAEHLPLARQNGQVVPAIFLGLLDVDPHATIGNLYKEWGLGQEGDVLLIAGHQAGADTRDTLSVEEIRRRLPQGNELVEIHSQIVADSTPEQAKWLCKKAEDLGIEAVALHAPQFHIPRALATVIQAMVELSIFLPVIPAPRLLEPDTSYPLAGFSDHSKSIELSLGEFERFVNYRGKGVASHAEVEDYLVQLKASLGIN